VNVSDGTAIAAFLIVVACMLAVCWPQRRRGVDPVPPKPLAKFRDEHDRELAEHPGRES
jgi:hypothetical protein